jgi:hypothetical protein
MELPLLIKFFSVKPNTPTQYDCLVQQNSVLFTSHMFRPFAGRHQAVLIKTYTEESMQSAQFSVIFTGVEIS